MAADNTLRFAVCLPRVGRPLAAGGGHLNTLRFADLLARRADVEILTYLEEEEDYGYLPREAPRLEREGRVAWITWGPHINDLLGEYHGRFPLIYYQQSLDWGIRLPPDVPVVSMSRWMMTNAQKDWPHSPQFHLPPVLPADCLNHGVERDIDVLVVPRKLPAYVLETLVPRLEGRCRLEVLESFVPRSELYALFNRAKVYLYAFAPQRSEFTASGWRYMEGISTQDLEALACGCTVISDLRGGQSDFLEPGVHGYRLMSHSPEWDVHQILAAVEGFPQPGHERIERRLLEDYGEAAFFRRLDALCEFLEGFLPFAAETPPRPEPFGVPEPVTGGRRVRERVVAAASRLKRRLLG